ncbi:hypothetical protein PFISCL1PPCAC_29179 [Pristionchus fissidentatus]|uniref:Tetratricopeptide repeat protein n=1 Tax=Pristionchus fissidentatus TaxID=1538716 RepID=A0AAV5X071_9BILA|nr:hypothetical protein PFISCL1PPCAC_29179 [Pristionchus fissidentatus]
MDALQAFICAVDLDPEHSAAWTNLGQLYEAHAQFADALSCYKNAIKFNPACPEHLKSRIIILERELALSPILAQPPNRPQGLPRHAHLVVLPALKEAGSQPIPSELRQRQDEFLKLKQQKYRDGSLLWRMGELAGVRSDPNVHHESRPLDPSQLNMLRILKYSESNLDDTCKRVLANLEHRFKREGCLDGSDLPLCKYTVSQLPSEIQAEDALRNFESLFDIDYKGDPIVKPKEEDDEDDERPTPGDDTITSTELLNAFSLLAPLKIPIDVTAAELMSQCHKRVERRHEFREMFEERIAPPSPPTPPAMKPGENLNRPHSTYYGRISQGRPLDRAAEVL